MSLLYILYTRHLLDQDIWFANIIPSVSWFFTFLIMPFYIVIFKLHIFLMLQYSHHQAISTQPGNQMHQCDKASPCQKFPFLPSPDYNLVTFEHTSGIPSCLLLVYSILTPIKALAHRSSHSLSWLPSFLVEPRGLLPYGPWVACHFSLS